MKPDTYVPDTGVVTSCYYVSLPTYSFSLSLLLLFSPFVFSLWSPLERLPTFGAHRSREYYAIVWMYIISRVSCIFFLFFVISLMSQSVAFCESHNLFFEAKHLRAVIAEVIDERFV